MTFLLLYVDVVLITGDDVEGIQALKGIIEQLFQSDRFRSLDIFSGFGNAPFE